MVGIGEMYDSTRDAVAIPGFDESAFYAGSPTADVLVVNEAPRGDAEASTVARAVERHAEGEWDQETLGEFLHEYPFSDDLGAFGFEGRNRDRLHRTYVDEILDFVDDPREDVGFTDLVKRPLDDGETLDDALDGDHEYGGAFAVQLQYVDPVAVVCNRSSVSRVVPPLLGLDPPTARDDLPTRLAVRLGDDLFALVFAAAAHASMDRFSRQRLGREVRTILRETE